MGFGVWCIVYWVWCVVYSVWGLVCGVYDVFGELCVSSCAVVLGCTFHVVLGTGVWYYNDNRCEPYSSNRLCGYECNATMPTPEKYFIYQPVGVW